MDNTKQKQTKKTRKPRRIAPTNTELIASLRCDFCGEHGHKAKNCPNKGD